MRRMSDIVKAQQRPILVRYYHRTLNDRAPERPSACVIVWDTALHGPVPHRIDPPISFDMVRIKSPDEFRSLRIGAKVLCFIRGTWWGAAVVEVDSLSKGLKAVGG